jgi:hypothetical protein
LKRFFAASRNETLSNETDVCFVRTKEVLKAKGRLGERALASVIGQLKGMED